VDATNVISQVDRRPSRHPAEALVKYVILIYGNPTSRELWATRSEAEQTAALEAHADLGAALAESGELVASEALEPARGLRVRVRDGQTITSDGPFAEAKEHLAGFYLIECPAVQRAVEVAASLPEAAFGLVEVCRAVELSELGRLRG
jgi:hypothetical protein